jgi:hypothetical protein
MSGKGNTIIEGVTTQKSTSKSAFTHMGGAYTSRVRKE